MTFLKRLSVDVRRHWVVYCMFLPFLAYLLVFSYAPMYGVVISFFRYNPARGIAGSTYVGVSNFTSFFNSYYFSRLTFNTFWISFLDLIFAFPANIIFALLLNEIQKTWFKRSVQTITYLPYFISIVVVCGLITDFTAKDGVINQVIAFFGGERRNLLMQKEMFRPIYIISNIWQGVGYGSIIYLAAIGGVNPELYEAANLDGAGRLRQTLHVTLPGIMPTVVTLLILRMGSLFSVGFEKILLLQNSSTYATSDVISTFVYRKGLQEANYGYSTAVGLFSSVINLIFLLSANLISRKVNETSLW